MTVLPTLLVLAIWIYTCVVLIQMANARHTALPTTVRPRRWHLPRRGAAARHANGRP
ncbi:hypothetical protein ABH931_003941 [Streptacidiphilus sp. MAP12-33]|uniref:hypothetical protein n=1 Tax=Streptacidiphilus sp. MAP12-33 TaxID=3156266 RepID=UPI003518FACD